MKLEKAIVICTPCQIASLDNLLKQTKKRDKFILVDLICHGVPSYLLWNKYIENKEIVDVKFRNKMYDWHLKAISLNEKKCEKENRSLFYNFFNIGNVYDEA